MTPAEQVKAQIITLQEKLLAQAPDMPLLLRDIHNQLKKDPEIVTLISEDEVCAIVSGLKKQTATEIITAASKSKKAAKPKVNILDTL